MIGPELLSGVCSALAHGNALRHDVDKALREAFPGISFSLCSDNDVPSRIKPLATGEGFALYGLNTGDHCAALTGDPENASGLVVALTEDEE